VTLTVKVTLRYAHLSSDHRKLALDVLCKIVTKGKIKKFTEGVDLEMLYSKEMLARLAGLEPATRGLGNP